VTRELIVSKLYFSRALKEGSSENPQRTPQGAFHARIWHREHSHLGFARPTTASKCRVRPLKSNASCIPLAFDSITGWKNTGTNKMFIFSKYDQGVCLLP